jgi:hypothetical protein
MLRTVWLLFAVSLIGCGGGAAVTADQACSDLATARCNKRQSCTNGAGITRTYGDLNTCLQREKLSCVDALAAPSQGNTPAGSESCSTTIAGMSCADFLSGNATSACIFAGALADGASCAFNGQCQSSYCTNEKLTACGTCGPAPSGSCDTTACARGQECVTDTTAMTMMCQTPGAMGAMCSKTLPCASDLTCVGTTPAAMGTCQPAVAMSGASCDPRDATGPACDGTIGLHCNGKTKLCDAIQFVGDGMPCGTLTDGTFAACAGGGLCALAAGATLGTCKAPAADGAACDTDVGPPCLAPAKCVTGGASTTAGTCQLPGATAC